jgi:hypothetical protein
MPASEQGRRTSGRPSYRLISVVNQADVDALGWRGIRFERGVSIACHTRVARLVIALIVDLWRSEHEEKT